MSRRTLRGFDNPPRPLRNWIALKWPRTKLLSQGIGVGRRLTRELFFEIVGLFGITAPGSCPMQ
jgi:hypothetical protein